MKRKLAYKVQTENSDPRLLVSETVVVKNGPNAYKSASILIWGDPQTREVRKKELRVQTWSRHDSGFGYDFSRTERAWHCEEEEITKLQGLLNSQFAGPGEYEFFKAEDVTSELIRRVRSNDIRADDVRSFVTALVENPRLSDAIGELNNADAFTSVVVRSRQSKGLDRLRAVVETPSSTEPQIQKILEEEWWVFGGRYVSSSVRRSFTALDQFDLALIRGDNSLHLVEIKQANISRLIVPDHNHWIVGPDVHKAVSQAMNYLRALDEQRAQINSDFDVECRRASATIVLGHPMFVANSPSRAQISDALRTYNSHLARIEVVTYEELLRGAARFLDLSEIESQEATATVSDIPHQEPAVREDEEWYRSAGVTDWAELEEEFEDPPEPPDDYWHQYDPEEDVPD